MLALLRRLHRLHVHAVLKADSGNSNIKFPRNEKNRAKDGRNKSCDGTSLNTSDKDIADAVERGLIAQGKNSYNYIGNEGASSKAFQI